MKPVYWIVLGACAVAGFMTTPASEAVRLAPLAKAAEIVEEQTGSAGKGPLGIAPAGTLIALCLTFGALGPTNPSSPMDRFCAAIQRMSATTRILNVGVATISLTAVNRTPTIFCLGALHNVKCLGFGRFEDKF